MSIDLLMDEVDFGYDPLPDLYERLSDLHKYGKVVPVKHWGKPAWLVLDYDSIIQTYQDQANFSPRAFSEIYSEPASGRTIQGMEGDEHRKHRGVVAPFFLPANVRALSNKYMLSVIDELLAGIDNKDGVEFIENFTRPLPFDIITRILGIPVPSDRKKSFMHWAVKMIDFPWDPEGATKAKAEFDAYVEPVVNQRRANPQDDLISTMTQAEIDGRPLTNENVMAFLSVPDVFSPNVPNENSPV